MLGSLKLAVERAVASRIIPKVGHLPRRQLAGASADGGAFDHTLWDEVLKAHVSPASGLIGDVVTSTIDYAGVAADPRFDAYLRSLAEVPDLDALAPAEQLALLINAYNALCVGLVVAHERQQPPPPPLRSILELRAGRVKVWDAPAGALAGRPVTLSEVEHVLLRGGWDEPAVHACIVCASASCPDLRAEAYVGPRLGEQMASQFQRFVSNRTKGLAWDGRTLTLSRIFLWYGADFGGESGAISLATDALAAEDGAAAAQVRGRPRRARRGYFAYNWQLNRTKAA